jgi:pSer/pThr/pTyr-binding forkhead associated (FHA) protein
VQREAGPELIMPLVDSVTVGRLEDNDIVVDDSTVSARHARLSRQNGNWIIEDTNSSNGTFLNGRRITEPIRIDDEDCVRVGRTTIKLELKSGR